MKPTTRHDLREAAVFILCALAAILAALALARGCGGW